MEKIVRDKIVDHMESNNLFTKHQHGFIFYIFYSCVCEKWTDELDNKNNIDIIYLLVIWMKKKNNGKYKQFLHILMIQTNFKYLSTDNNLMGFFFSENLV